MKTLPLKLMAVLLIIPLCSFVTREVKGKYTKEKKIQKVYLVNADAGLEVNNQYGNIYVTTWDENKTSVDVVIKVSGNSEDKVNKRLNGIDVALNATKSMVACKTQIEGSGSGTSIEINYTIKIPRKGAITLKNQYGGITLGTINGASQLKCQYGNINAGELNNGSNYINMEYCDGSSITYINNVDIKCEYSGVNIAKANTVNAKSSYTNFSIDDVKDISLNAEYGDVKIKSANRVNVSGDYVGLRFGTINKSLYLNSNYGNVDIKSIAASAETVTINSTYTNVNINMSENFSFDFDFSLEYGNLNGYKGLNFTQKNIKNTSAQYKGYCKKSGTNKVSINCEYGNINLGSN
ncbi:hypothetical protein [Flavobacterium alkalisoli]|uniref:hypothetical protein n=1 Tax=Flavobacterium alkalisoli TaxID=2602769 RepID=UPI003A8E1D51